MSVEELDKLEALMESLVAKLAEHCDSVRIVSTVHDGATGETTRLSKGSGNLYAQLASVEDWHRAVIEGDRDD